MTANDQRQLTVVLLNSGDAEIAVRDDDKEPAIAKAREVLRQHGAGLADDPDHLTGITIESEQEDGAVTAQRVFLAGDITDESVAGAVLTFWVPSGQDRERLAPLLHIGFTNEDQGEMLAASRAFYVAELAPAFQQTDADVPHFEPPTTPLLTTMATPEVLHYPSEMRPLCVLAEALAWAWLPQSLH